MLMRAIILFMSIFYAHIGVSDGSPCQHQHCIAVVDLGSTGSRAHLYAYDLNAQQEPVNIQEIWSNHHKPGFATLNLEDDSTTTYLDDLFATAPSMSLPTYFYATGGMRLLPFSQQSRYFDVIKDWVEGHDNIQLREARTLTGQEEGYYAPFIIREMPVRPRPDGADFLSAAFERRASFGYHRAFPLHVLL